ncbi:branched-chain amino acid ABC transporter permease [Thalassovita taeanensis]|nr:branched-chain amino acid ABC transporter permease [Thalassovita taeanensis]
MVALIGAPMVLDAHLLGLVTVILFTLVGALGLNILMGYTGLVSLGHVGFLVLGAYGYAVTVGIHGLHPLLGFLMAGIVPAIAGVIVGAPSLRLKGIYLAITTMAFAFIINTAILEADFITNGSSGIFLPRPTMFGISFKSDAAFYWLCLFFAVAALAVTLNIRRSRIGRAFMAIRDNDIAAQSMGINLIAYKLLAFVMSAFMTGIAGALFGVYLSFVTVEGFTFHLTIEALAILVVGGLGSALGVVLGTILIVLLPEITGVLLSLTGDAAQEVMATKAFEVRNILYGVIIIGFLRFDPTGLVGIWKDVQRTWVNWPLKY